MDLISKILEIAENEVGYLEKKSNANLDSKTANAGSGNYTKYWRDVRATYQGQPWCACFVTWCIDKAIGQDKTKQLLKHYPYVYCPTLAKLFARNSNPKRGDVVVFYRDGEFCHTGFVTKVNGDYFETIEGNTSGGNSIVANGGGVCKKSYYNSELPGTKFIRPDYEKFESEELTMAQYEELKNEIDKLIEAINTLTADIQNVKNPMIYNYIDSNMPEWAIPTVQKLVDKGYLKGDEEGKLNLNDDILRMLVIEDRAGCYGA